jgi:hypothetical protein
MADNPEPIQVSIIAEIKGLMDGLGQATSGVKSATEEMGKSFSGLAQTINNLKAPFLALTGLVAGGSMFKGAIDETINWASEVNKLSKSMAVNMDQASTWAVMLHTLGVSSDTMAGLMQKLQVRVTSGGKAFEAYGISTKAANGAILPTGEILQNVIAKYQTLGTQSEKNQMLAALFGRSWMQVQTIMRATADRMAEAKQEAQEFGLEVGPDGVAKAREYKESLNKISMIGMSMANMIGQNLLPMLTGFGKFLGSTGPSLAQGFGYALKSIASIAYELVAVFQTAGSVIGGILLALYDGLKTIVTALLKVATGDFKGAWETMKDGFSNIVNDAKGAAHEVSEAWKNASNSMYQTWYGKTKAKGGDDGPMAMPGPDMSKQPKDKKDKDDSAEVMAALRQELDAKKSLEENWFTWSTTQEMQYWQSKLKEVTAGSKAAAQVEDEINKLKRKAGEQGEKDAEKDADRKIQMAKEGSQERITLAQQEADRIGAKYNYQGEVYRAALDKVEAATKAHQQKMIELDKLIEQNHRDAALEQLDTDLQIAQEQQSAGLISKQKLLAAEMKYEQDKFAIMWQAANAEAALEPDPVKHQELLNKIEQIDRQHQARITALDRQAIADRRQSFNTWISGMTSGMETAFAGLVKGTMSWGKAFQTVMSSAVDFAIKQLWKMLAQHITVEASKTSATVAGTTARTGVEQVAATKSLAMKVIDGIRHLFTETGKTTATTTGAATRAGVDAAATAKSATADAGELAAHTATETAKTAATTTAVTARVLAAELGNVLEIMSLSAVAAAAAFASTAAIPIVGPAAAPAAATAAEAAVMAFAPMASAAGGWERVPADQMAMIHKNEQVLPASYAEGLRNLVKNGGGGGDTHVHANFSGVIDAKSFFQKNQGDLVGCIKDAVKNRRG